MSQVPDPAQVKQALQLLAQGRYSSSESRDRLLQVLAQAQGLPAGNVAWMLFRPDRRLRETALELLRRSSPRAVADAFIAECSRQHAAAIRAAAATLLPSAPPGVTGRLRELLDSDNPAVRDVTMRAILAAPPVQALQGALWQLLATASDAARLQILERLEQLEPGDAELERWRELADNPRPEIRQRAIRVLATRAPERFKDLLIEEVPRADPETLQVLVAAISAAAAREGMAMADRLFPLLGVGEPAVRQAAVTILSAIPDHAALIHRFVDFSRNLLGWVRERALGAFSELGPDIGPALRHLLGDPNPSIRATALSMLESMGDPELFEAVLPLLEDDDWWIRVSAANALAQMGDRRAVGPLVKVLGDEETRWAAVEALGRLGDPRALPALAKLLGSSSTEVRIEALLALRNFDHPNLMAAFRRVAANDPERIVRARAVELMEELASRTGQKIDDLSELRSAPLHIQTGRDEPQIHPLLAVAREREASDLHLTPGRPPILRIASMLVPLEEPPLTPQLIETMIREILDESSWKRLQKEQQLDHSYFLPSAGRFRGNAFVDRLGLNAVFRVIPETAPTLSEIGLPDHLHSIIHEHQGLILIAGPAGSGKSTTLTALVNLFNEKRRAHIISLEDPVEFVHPFKQCLVNQREVGRDTAGFSRALRAALREDPDIIVIGDLRDNETVSLALTAAETGHIVLGTLSSTDAVKAIDRIITSFPAMEQPQIRMGLSDSLTLVIAQKLLKAARGRRQVACFEILKGIPSVSNLIREGKTIQLRSAIQTGRVHGMMSFDDSLRVLLDRGDISEATARRAAMQKTEFGQEEENGNTAEGAGA